MTTILMPEAQQSRGCPAWAWQLPRHGVRRLPADRQARWLAVRQGQLWVTTHGTGPRVPADVWLLANDAVLLPAGVDVVVEAWVDSRFELLLAAPATRRAPFNARSAYGARWAAWLQPLRLALGPRRGVPPSLALCSALYSTSCPG